MSQLRNALQDLRSNHLNRRSGVIGVGVTRLNQHTVIVVQLADEDSAEGIPPEVCGIEVRTEISGRVHTLSNKR